jgi:hypothetical protein
MSQLYDLEFNKDDVVIRNILIGVLATLNNRMYWYNQISETEKRKIPVPFYFSTTGDERFLMDCFMNNVAYEDPTLPSGKAEGVYNKIPRGILQLDGVNIDAGSLTNKFVRAFYQRVQDDGTLKTFNSEVFMVPLKLPFTGEIYVDSNLDIFKAIQRLLELFYKHQVFQVDIDGTRIPAVAHMPEDYQKERPIEYSFQDKKVWKVTFAIEVDTFMPIFKNEDNGFIGPANTEMFAGNIIESWQNGMNIGAPGGGGIGSIDPYTGAPGGNEYNANKQWQKVNARFNNGNDAWPNDPSGFAHPLPPDGGATSE